MREITYGYVRVSTRDQNETRQLDAMREFGVAEEHIIVEKQSGKDFKRPSYQRLMQSLRPGDVLVVKSIDRLGRNYAEILEQWGMITKQLEAAIVVLDMHLLDTRRGRDLNPDRRHCASAAQLRGPDRTGKHPPAPGGGHRRRAPAGDPVRPQAHGNAGTLLRAGPAVDRRPGLLPEGRVPAGHLLPDLPP